MYINEDFSDLLLKTRAELVPAMQEAIEKENSAVSTHDQNVDTEKHAKKIKKTVSPIELLHITHATISL